MAGSLSAFKVELGPASVKITVDGRDVSAEVESVQIAGGSTAIPQVMLVMRAGSVEVVGDGLVGTLRDGAVDAFLSTIDAEELEGAALSRSPYSTSITSSMLEILRERANDANSV